MGTPLSRTVKPPAYLPNIQSASTRHSPMSPSQMPANTGIGILLGATLLFSALSGATAETETWTIDPESLEHTDAFTGETCLSYTLTLTNGLNDNVLGAVYTTTNAEAIHDKATNEEYASVDDFIADLKTKAETNSLCTFDKYSVCSRVVTLTATETYYAGMANGDTQALTFESDVHDCSTENTELIDETFELAPQSVEVTEADTGLTCLKVTMSMSDDKTNTDVIAGMYTKANAEEMSNKDYTSANEVFTDMENKGVEGSVCKFDSSATCTNTIKLEPTETYVGATGNKGSVSYKVNAKVESCTDKEAKDLGLNENPPSQGSLAAGTSTGKNPYLPNNGAAVSGAETISRVALTALLAAMLLLAM